MPRHIVGALGIVEKCGMVVLVKRGSKPYENKWGFLSGTVELYEQPQSTVIREVKEETGLTVSDPKLYEVKVFASPDASNSSYLAIFFVCKLSSSQQGLMVGSDVKDVRWVFLRKAIFLVDVAPPVVSVLRSYSDDKIKPAYTISSES